MSDGVGGDLAEEERLELLEVRLAPVLVAGWKEVLLSVSL